MRRQNARWFREQINNWRFRDTGADGKGRKVASGFADKIELRITDGLSLEVPIQTFDSLIDEHRIVSENGAPSGFYRLA